MGTRLYNEYASTSNMVSIVAKLNRLGYQHRQFPAYSGTLYVGSPGVSFAGSSFYAGYTMTANGIILKRRFVRTKMTSYVGNVVRSKEFHLGAKNR